MPEERAHHEHDAVKAKPGASWKDNEQHVLPKNRLGIVFFGLCCCIFLAAIDQVLSIFGFRYDIVNLTDLSLPPDHRCNGFAHNYRTVRRRCQLQLGRQVRCVIFDISAPSILFLFFTFSAYLLAAASLGPLYGKLSDLIGELARECMKNSNFIICFRTKAYIICIYYHLLGVSHV